MPKIYHSAALFSSALFACSMVLAQTPAAPEAGAPQQPAITSTASAEVAQFQKIEDAWSAAVNKRDQFALELVLSPLVVDISASGEVTTRNQQVAQLLGGDDKTIYLTQKVVTVRMLGDIAVANGTYTLHHKVNSAQVDEKGVFTHVFQRVRSGWQCINSQRTILRQDPSSNIRQKKTQGSESPFHIPLFTKGDK